MATETLDWLDEVSTPVTSSGAKPAAPVTNDNAWLDEVSTPVDSNFLDTVSDPIPGVDPREAFAENLANQDIGLVEEAFQMKLDAETKRKEASQLSEGDPMRLQLEQEAFSLEDSIPAYERAFAIKAARENKEWREMPFREKVTSFMSNAGEVAKELPGAAMQIAGDMVQAVPEVATAAVRSGWTKQSLPLNMFEAAMGIDSTEDKQKAQQELTAMGQSSTKGWLNLIPSTGRAIAKARGIDEEDARGMFNAILQERMEQREIETGKNNILADITGQENFELDPEKIQRGGMVVDFTNVLPIGAGVGAVTKAGGRVLSKVPGVARASRAAGAIGGVTGKVADAVMNPAKSAVGRGVEFVGDSVSRYGKSRFASNLAWGSIVGGALSGNPAGVAIGIKGLLTRRASQKLGPAIANEGRRLQGEFIPKGAVRSAVEGTIGGTARGATAGTVVGGAMTAPFLLDAETPEEAAMLLAPGTALGGAGGGLAGGVQSVMRRNTPPGQRGVSPDVPPPLPEEMPPPLPEEMPPPLPGEAPQLPYTPTTQRNPMTDGGAPVFTGEVPPVRQPAALPAPTIEMQYSPEAQAWVPIPKAEEGTSARPGMDPEYVPVWDPELNRYTYEMKEGTGNIDLNAFQLGEGTAPQYQGQPRPVRQQAAPGAPEPILALPEPQKVQGKGNYNADALLGLQALGFKKSYAESLLDGLPEADTETSLREALKRHRTPAQTTPAPIDPTNIPKRDVEVLAKVRDNEATPQQIESLESKGLVETVGDQAIIKDPAIEALTRQGEEAPALSEAQRRAEVDNVIEQRIAQMDLGMDVPVNEPAAKAPVKRGPRKPQMNGEQLTFDFAEPETLSKLRKPNRNNEGGFVEIPSWDEIKDLGVSLYDGAKDFAQWSADMVGRLGDTIKDSLQYIWDQITAFYQSSYMSDETGAVGNLTSPGLQKFTERVQSNQKAAKASQDAKGGMIAEPGSEGTPAGIQPDKSGFVIFRGVSKDGLQKVIESGGTMVTPSFGLTRDTSITTKFSGPDGVVFVPKQDALKNTVVFDRDAFTPTVTNADTNRVVVRDKRIETSLNNLIQSGDSVAATIKKNPPDEAHGSIRARLFNSMKYADQDYVNKMLQPLEGETMLQALDRNLDTLFPKDSSPAALEASARSKGRKSGWTQDEDSKRMKSIADAKKNYDNVDFQNRDPYMEIKRKNNANINDMEKAYTDNPEVVKMLQDAGFEGEILPLTGKIEQSAPEGVKPTNEQSTGQQQAGSQLDGSYQGKAGGIPIPPNDIGRRGQEFHRGIQRVYDEHPQGKAVTVKDLAFYQDPQTSLFMAEDGSAGVAVTPEGDLVSVFKNKDSKQPIRPLLEDAAKVSKTLDAYDINGYLPTLYSEFGFEPVAKMKFNREFAPDGWDYATLGEPDIVFMAKTKEPGTKTDFNSIRENIPTVEDWDAGVSLQQKTYKLGEYGVGDRVPNSFSTARGASNVDASKNISHKDVDPVLLKKQMDHIKYDWLPDEIRKQKNPVKKAEAMINWMKDNLVALVQSVPPETVAKTRQWYDTANKFAKEKAKQYNVSLEQISAVIANYSPQKDWNMNRAQAEQFLDVYFNKMDTKFEGEAFRSELDTIVNSITAKGADADAARADRRAFLSEFEGKSINELDTPVKKAWAIRLRAQMDFGQQFDMWSPTGENLGPSVKKSDGLPSKNTWGSALETIKNLQVMENGSMEVISNSLGKEHKVRSFYNNIADPSSLVDITVDTHAVAAAHLLPVGGSHYVVLDNFGSKPKDRPSIPSSGSKGVSGVYHLYHEAYMRAAKELNLSPRELQSIAWEAVRELYPSEARGKSKDGFSKATDIWKQNDSPAARDLLLNKKAE